MVLLTAAWLTAECTSCVPVCLWHSKSLCLGCLGVNFQAVTLPAAWQAAEAYQEWITMGDKHNFEGILWFSSSFYNHFLRPGYFRVFSWLVFTRSHKSDLHWTEQFSGVESWANIDLKLEWTVVYSMHIECVHRRIVLSCKLTFFLTKE